MKKRLVLLALLFTITTLSLTTQSFALQDSDVFHRESMLIDITQDESIDPHSAPLPQERLMIERIYTPNRNYRPVQVIHASVWEDGINWVGTMRLSESVFIGSFLNVQGVTIFVFENWYSGWLYPRGVRQLEYELTPKYGSMPGLFSCFSEIPDVSFFEHMTSDGHGPGLR